MQRHKQGCFSQNLNVIKEQISGRDAKRLTEESESVNRAVITSYIVSVKSKPSLNLQSNSRVQQVHVFWHSKHGHGHTCILLSV